MISTSKNLSLVVALALMSTLLLLFSMHTRIDQTMAHTRGGHTVCWQPGCMRDSNWGKGRVRYSHPLTTGTSDPP